MAVHDLQNRVHDVLHGLSVVFPPVAGYDDHAPVRKIKAIQLCNAEVEVFRYGVAHRVDRRVASDEDIAHDRLTAQVLRIRLRGRKMQVRNVAHQRPVHFLREGRILIPRAKPGFDMPHLHLMVKCRQRACKRRGRVAVDQNEVRLVFFKDFLHAKKRLRRDRGKRLPLFHNIEVKIRLEVEDFHDGIEHLAVLTGQADVGFDFLPALQLLHQRRHLNRLRARAEDGHHFDFTHVVPPEMRKTDLPILQTRPARTSVSAQAPACRRSRAYRLRRRRRSCRSESAP